MVKKNDTSYVPILAIEALGIIIDFITLASNTNIALKVLRYIISVLLPGIIILLEKKNINIMSNIKIYIININMMTGNQKKAKELLIKMIDKDNQIYELHKKLGEIYEKEGGSRKAIDEYIQCININDKDYETYYKISTLLTDLDRKTEAIEMLNNLLAKNPENKDASLLLGDLLIEQKSYKEAVMIYSDALKYNPVSYELNYELGIVFTLLNDFSNAKICYEKAANINHLSYTAKYNLAEIALIYKDLEKAEEYFMQALNNDEFTADSYFELAKINLMKGNKELAIKYANTAVEINSKKIAEKIQAEPLFMTIRKKLYIPFNLEEKEDLPSLNEKEKLAKNHLENTTDITTNMGYGKGQMENLNIELKNKKEKQNSLD